MKKIISRILVVLFLWNILQPAIYPVYGAPSNDFVFDWDQAYIMNDVLSTEIHRGQADKDKAMLYWDFEKINGSTYRNGVFELKYHLEDEKTIIFEVNKNTDYSEVTYTLEGKSWDRSKFRIYDERNQRWISPQENEFKVSDEVYAYDINAGANFRIIPGTGFSFQVDGRLIRFKWAKVKDPLNPLTQKDMFYFMTDGIDLGKIYPFELVFKENKAGNAIVSRNLNILTGVANFRATPLSNEEVKELVDQVNNSDENPGSNPGIRLRFDMPYAWDESVEKFVQDGNQLSGTIARINMEKIQMIIPDLATLTGITRSDNGKVKARLDAADKYYEIDFLDGLEASKIYDPTHIILDKGDDFKTERTELNRGRVYTYLEYSVERRGPDQLYLRVTPYKGLSGYYTGTYTSYVGGSLRDTYNETNKWVEYEERVGTGDPIYIPIYLNDFHESYYRISFRLTDGNTPISSQVLYYKTDGEEEYLGAPEKLEIIETKVVPSQTENQTPEKVDATLKWEIGKDEVFKKLLTYGNIEFRLYKSLKPVEGYETEPFITMTASLDGDSNVVLVGDKLLDSKYTVELRNVGGKQTGVGIFTVTLDLKDEVAIPGIYFFKMNAGYRVGNDPRVTDDSLPANVTLDYKGAVVPQPQNLRVPSSSIQAHEFQAVWDTVTAAVYGTYEDYVLKPMGFDMKSIEYRIFITQNRDLLVSHPTVIPSVVADTGALDLSQQLEALRKGQLVSVTVRSTVQKDIQELLMQGLDSNQVYYLGVQTVIHVQKESEPVEARISDMSAIVSVTTKKEVVNPDPDEKVPAAPESFTKDDVTPNSVKLFWTKSATPSVAEERIEYELVRVRNSELKDMNSREAIDKIMDQYGNAVAWRTKEGGLTVYSNGAFIPNTNDGYVYDNIAVPLTIMDATLSPNQLYYYYVRTVRMVGDEVKARSSWKGLSVTTSPIEKPINLQIERGYTFDKKTQTFISFDVRIPKNGKTPVEMVNDGEYEFRIAIKEDGKDEYIETVSSTQYNARYWEEIESSSEYRHFRYRIEGLKPGRSYSFKVRVIDLKLGVGSLYSNVATTRTDMDQDDYDAEQGVDKWIKVFEDEIKKLKNSTYWVLQDTTSTFEALYRTDRTIQEILLTNPYDLAGADKSRQIYYIPAKTLQQINAGQVSLRIKKGSTEVVIPPNSLDPNTTQAILDMQKRIKSNNLQEYFIKFTVDWDAFSSKIDGNTPVSDRIQIRIEIVGTTVSERKIEQDISAAIDHLIAQSKWKSELQTELSRRIREGVAEERLLEIVMKMVGEVQKEVTIESRRIFERVNKNSSSVTAVEMPILILAGGLEGSIRSYRYIAGAWKPVENLRFGAKNGIEITEAGIYIFAAGTTQLNQLNGLQNSSQIKDIFAKYNLDDFFGKDITWNVNANASRYMLIGSVARMAGAPRGQESVAWLQSKGVSELSTRNLHDAITNQEAVYLLMKLYELKTGTKIETIRISNYHAISNLNTIEQRYQRSALVASELGVLQNGMSQPNGRLTIRQVLEMLGLLGAKIRL